MSSHPSEVAPGDIAIGVIIGRTSEYFDYFVYGIASVLVFPAIFFPFESRLDGTLWSFAIFSLAFIARPIGSMVFMDIQRRWGRGPSSRLRYFSSAARPRGLPSCQAREPWLHGDRDACDIAHRPGRCPRRILGRIAVTAGAIRTEESSRLVRDDGAAGSAGWFHDRERLYLLLYATLSLDDFLTWGWRYPFFCAFAINVVALFARLRLVLTHEFEELLTESELEPSTSREVLGSQGYNVILGAFGALASYALFHVVTVFPLSWILLYSKQSVTAFLAIQILAAIVGIGGVVASGVIADQLGRRKTLGCSPP